MSPPSILGTGLAGVLAGTRSQKGLSLQGHPGVLGHQILGQQTLGHYPLGKAGTELELEVGPREDFVFNWHLAKGRIRACKSRVREGVKTSWD